ncbi:DUF1642 domain-containing protein [Tetragenococcus halophilus]|uniref:DUF1642 domain-containing protein n=1 Tax=Tetragenococcus halophilus TaxID=51669 RepID=UPI00209A7341|nr:DUF1642 domain-containing protein [Tetragenococcus halophilus]MCO8292636.1 DUF1642 domain-containing protein [Tetragenococcus halophilus]
MDKQELLSVLGERIVKEEKEITDVSDWINGYYCGRVDAMNFTYNRVEWLDEPEITTEQAWEKIAEGYDDDAEMVKSICMNALRSFNGGFPRLVTEGHIRTWNPDVGKPEIPPKIAERIEEERADGQSDSAIYSILQSEKETRMWSMAHKDDLMKALINGYTIEKEPVWVVRINEKLYFCRFTDKYFEKDSDAPTYIESGNPSLIKKFTNKDKAEAVATLVDGTVEEWSA